MAYKLHLRALNISSTYHKKWLSSIMTDKAKQPWVDGPYRLIETPGKSYGVNVCDRKRRTLFSTDHPVEQVNRNRLYNGNESQLIYSSFERHISSM